MQTEKSAGGGKKKNVPLMNKKALNVVTDY